MVPSAVSPTEIRLYRDSDVLLYSNYISLIYIIIRSITTTITRPLILHNPLPHLRRWLLTRRQLRGNLHLHPIRVLVRGHRRSAEPRAAEWRKQPSEWWKQPARARHGGSAARCGAHLLSAQACHVCPALQPAAGALPRAAAPALPSKLVAEHALVPDPMPTGGALRGGAARRVRALTDTATRTGCGCHARDT